MDLLKTDSMESGEILLEVPKSSQLELDESNFYKGIFPFMFDHRTYTEYRRKQNLHLNICQLFPVSIACLIAAATRVNISHLSTDHIYFLFGNIALFISILVYLPLFIPVLMKEVLEFKNEKLSTSYRMIRRFLASFIPGLISDGLVVVSSIGICILLYARITAGQCKDLDDTWSIQQCNPVADSRSIPQDHVIFIYLWPVLVQSILRNSIQACLLSWAICVIFVIISIKHVKGWYEIWTCCYSLFFAYILILNERYMRLSFLDMRTTMLVEKNRRKLLDAQKEERIQIEEERRRNATAVERGRQERLLVEMEAKQMRGLIGNVAHDLKTPLQSFRMDLDMVNRHALQIRQECNISNSNERNCEIAQEQAMSLEVLIASLDSACSFMLMIINRGLDFTKASNGIALTPALTSFDLYEAVLEPIKCIRHLQAGVEVTIHPLSPPDACWSIISDRHWLCENVLCYLSNAVKYGNGSDIDIFLELVSADTAPYHNENQQVVELFSNKSSEFVKVTVRDGGIGVPDEAKNDLFLPFRQTQRMAVGGSGLGLYSLSKRMEALHGSCGVDSRSDGSTGSCFWFQFPYRPDPTYENDSNIECDDIDASIDVDMNMKTRRNVQADLSINTSRSNYGSTMSDGSSVSGKCSGWGPRPLKVLIVDDSLSILRVTSRVLEQNGHVVSVATNGAVALQLLYDGKDKGQFDVVLMDLQMPVMDGIEAITRFRKYEKEINSIEKEEKMIEAEYGRAHRLLIVGVSANSDTDTRMAALSSGADFFLPKPYTYDDLLLCLLKHF